MKHRFAALAALAFVTACGEAPTEPTPTTTAAATNQLELAPASIASTFYYVDWTSGSMTAGTVEGVINVPGQAPITVKFKVLNPNGTPGSFYGFQTDASSVYGSLAGWGIHNYWATNNYAPYVGSVVANGPTFPDLVALRGGTTSSYVITFSAPVQDPVMDVLSLGNGGTGATYAFDRSFEIISTGTGFWGGGPFYIDGGLSSGSKLIGYEGHGAIRFSGSMSTFSWTVPNPEEWHAFTLAIRGPGDPNADSDGDGVRDADDNCVAVANPGQEDSDFDGIGDFCDSSNDGNADTDGDGLTNSQEHAIGTSPTNPDTDGDGHGDAVDAFPTDGNEWADSDHDGVGDNGDAFPNDPTEWADTDGDGHGDNGDAFPNDSSEWTDTDGDGVGDNSDAYVSSDTRPTVIIGTCDAGVTNKHVGGGSFFNDLIAAAKSAAKNHGGFVKAVANLTDGWKKAGLITGREEGAITSCAARSK